MYQRGVIVFGLLLAMLPIFGIERTSAASATFFYSPSTIRINVGQTATVQLSISSPNQAINSADGRVVLPSSQVSAVSVSKSGSIFTNWPEEPTISGSTIRFAGGLPTPGYKGSSGKVISFTIRGNAEGTGVITLSGGRILANNSSSTNIYSGAGIATVVVSRTVSGAVISSGTHPKPTSWYNSKDLSLSWTRPSGVTSYSYSLSHSTGQTGQSGTTGATTVKFEDLADGVWTFRLTTNYSDGKTATSSFTIQIDTTPPDHADFTTIRKNGSTDPFPVIKFEATDALSGISKYQIVVDGNETFETTKNSIKLPRQVPGKHQVVFRAYDKAGNFRETVGNFEVDGFAGPTITDSSNLLSIFQKIELTGKAQYGNTLNLFIDGKQVHSVLVKDILSEQQKASVDIASANSETTVEWHVQLTNGLFPGVHTIFATQTKPDGALSTKSNEVSIRVLVDSVTVLGIKIPLVILVLFTIAVLILTIIASLIWIRALKSRLSRGGAKNIKVVEEIVDKNLSGLQHDLERKLGHNSFETSSIISEEVNQTQENIDNEIDGIVRKTGQSEKDPPNDTK